jgi:hypothetical protein
MTQRFVVLRDRGQALIANLEAIGIRVPGASRLREYVNVLAKALSYETRRRPTSAELAVLHRLYVELEEFETIYDCLGKDPEVVGWQRCAERALCGSILPRTDTNTAARNIQFELIVAAFMRSAGIEVTIDEPDVRARDEDGEFAVAVKRVRSASKVAYRLKEARNQILRSGRPGIIAVDLSSVINPADTPVDKSASQLAFQTNSSYFKRHIKPLRSQLGSDQVFGLLLHQSQLVHDAQELKLSYQRHWVIVNTLPMKHSGTLRLQRLERRLRSSWMAG